MNVIAEIQRINQAELENGSVGTSASWHAKYADTAWVFVGNLPMQLTEGDVICVMSQFGEVSALCFLVCIYMMYELLIFDCTSLGVCRFSHHAATPFVLSSRTHVPVFVTPPHLPSLSNTG
jgi:hypothetical protein